jgi:hypothetical protein
MEAVVELEMGAIGDQQTPVDVIERLANVQSVDAAKECLTALSSFLDDPELVKQGGIQQAAVIRAANAAKKTIGEGWAESVDEYRALLYKFAESADEGIVEPPSEEAIRREENREEPRAVAPKSGNKAMKGAGKRPGSCCLRCCTNCLFLVVLIASILWGVQLTGLIMPKFGFPASPPSGERLFRTSKQTYGPHYKRQDSPDAQTNTTYLWHYIPQAKLASVRTHKRWRQSKNSCRFIRRSYTCDGAAYMSSGFAETSPDAILIDEDYNALVQDTLVEHTYPFPSNTTTLFLGNSHLREVVEALNCQFTDAMQSFEVYYCDTRCKMQAASLGPVGHPEGCGWIDILRDDGWARARKLRAQWVYNNAHWGEGAMVDDIMKVTWKNGARSYQICNVPYLMSKTLAEMLDFLQVGRIDQLDFLLLSLPNGYAWAQTFTQRLWSCPKLAYKGRGPAEALLSWIAELRHNTKNLTRLYLKNPALVSAMGLAWKKTHALEGWPFDATVIRDLREVGICAVPTCNRSQYWQHQCIPGPPDTLARWLVEDLHAATASGSHWG